MTEPAHTPAPTMPTDEEKARARLEVARIRHQLAHPDAEAKKATTDER